MSGTEIKEEVAAKLEEVKEEITEKAEEVKEAAADMIEAVMEQAETVPEDVAQQAEEAGGKIDRLEEEIAKQAAEFKENFTEEAARVKEEITEKADHVKEEITEKAEAVKEEVEVKSAAVKEEVSETMADYKDELEASLKQGPPESDPVWARFEELLESKEAIPVKIDSVVKGGVIAMVDGVRGFIPASKASLNHVEDLESLKGQETEAVVITAEKAGKKLVLSVRDALRKKEKENRAAAMAQCTEGAVLEGTVDSVMEYGAFIKLEGGLSGLLHVSQISHERVKTPADVLTKGDKITVKVIAVKDGKISLSKKALEEAPAEKKRRPREDHPDREGNADRPRRDRRDKEEVFNYKEPEKASTSLADLLSGLKL